MAGNCQLTAHRPGSDTRSRIGIRTLSSWKPPASTTRPTWNGEGLPHSEDLLITERYRRPDFGHLVVEFTFTDPKNYERPWTVTIPFNLMPDTELMEHLCESEKDLIHMYRK